MPAGRPGGRSIVVAVAALLAAATVGGVVGGVIVWQTTGNGSSASAPASGSSGTAAACRAANVADEALPSVVTVRAGAGEGAGTGSGVVIRSGGYVLTNNHVIAPAAAGGGPLSILRGDGETTEATIVGRDPLTDLAVIKAQNSSGLPAITLGRSDALKVGQPVVALGSPLGWRVR
jgi:putative serine protease PepD